MPIKILLFLVIVSQGFLFSQTLDIVKIVPMKKNYKSNLMFFPNVPRVVDRGDKLYVGNGRSRDGHFYIYLMNKESYKITEIKIPIDKQLKVNDELILGSRKSKYIRRKRPIFTFKNLVYYDSTSGFAGVLFSHIGSKVINGEKMRVKQVLFLRWNLKKNIITDVKGLYRSLTYQTRFVKATHKSKRDLSYYSYSIIPGGYNPETETFYYIKIRRYIVLNIKKSRRTHISLNSIAFSKTLPIGGFSTYNRLHNVTTYLPNKNLLYFNELSSRHNLATHGYLFDLNKHSMIKRKIKHFQYGHAISPDGKRIYSISLSSGYLRVFDIRKKQIIKKIHLKRGATSIAFLEGKTLVAFLPTGIQVISNGRMIKKGNFYPLKKIVGKQKGRYTATVLGNKVILVHNGKGYWLKIK